MIDLYAKPQPKLFNLWPNFSKIHQLKPWPAIEPSLLHVPACQVVPWWVKVAVAVAYYSDHIGNSLKNYTLILILLHLN